MAGSDLSSQITFLYQSFQEKQKELKPEERTDIKEDSFRKSLEEVFKKSGLKNKSIFLDVISNEIEKGNFHISADGFIDMSSAAITRAIDVARKDEIKREDELDGNNRQESVTEMLVSGALMSATIFNQMSDAEKVEYFVDSTKGILDEDVSRKFVEAVLSGEMYESAESVESYRRLVKEEGTEEDKGTMTQYQERARQYIQEKYADLSPVRREYLYQVLLKSCAESFANFDRIANERYGLKLDDPEEKGEFLSQLTNVAKTISFVKKQNPSILPEDLRKTVLALLEKQKLTGERFSGSIELFIEDAISGRLNEELKALNNASGVIQLDDKVISKVLDDVKKGLEQHGLSDGRDFKSVNSDGTPLPLKDIPKAYFGQDGEVEHENNDGRRLPEYLFSAALEESKLIQLEQLAISGRNPSEAEREELGLSTWDRLGQEDRALNNDPSIISMIDTKEHDETKAEPAHKTEETSEPILGDLGEEQPEYEEVSLEVDVSDMDFLGALEAGVGLESMFGEMTMDLEEEEPITSGPPDNADKIIAELEEEIQIGESPEMPDAPRPESDVRSDEPENPEDVRGPDIPDLSVEIPGVEPPSIDIEPESAEIDTSKQDSPIGGGEPIDVSKLEVVDMVVEKASIPEKTEPKTPDYEGPVATGMELASKKPKSLFQKLGDFAKSVFDKKDKSSLADKWNKIFHKDDGVFIDDSSGANSSGSGGKEGNTTPTEEMTKLTQMRESGLQLDPNLQAKVDKVVADNKQKVENKKEPNRGEGDQKNTENSEIGDDRG